MSHFWHAHWAEDAFKSKRLQNWEVPRWHCEHPDRHCSPTKFEAHKNGRVFASFKRTNPWGNYKGTWELPSKIDRKTADKLSRLTENKKAYWKNHKANHENCCKRLTKEDHKEQKKEEKNQEDNLQI